MSTLHTLNKAPSNSSLWHDCQRALQAGDTLLLIENGVYGCADDIFTAQIIAADIKVYALRADLAARGITLSGDSGVAVASDDDFIRLSIENNKVISWF